MVTVTLTIDPSKLTKTLDPTMRRVEQGLLRQYQADASGLVIFSNDGQPDCGCRCTRRRVRPRR